MSSDLAHDVSEAIGMHTVVLFRKLVCDSQLRNMCILRSYVHVYICLLPGTGVALADHRCDFCSCLFDDDVLTHTGASLMRLEAT